MGLIGKYTHIENQVVEGETQIVTIEHPKNLDENDRDFEKAGTTEELEVPKVIQILTDYEEAYINIKATTTFKYYQRDKTVLNITYEVFKSKQDRIDNPLKPLKTDSIEMIEIKAGVENDILKGYEILSMQPSFTDFIVD